MVRPVADRDRPGRLTTWRPQVRHEGTRVQRNLITRGRTRRRRDRRRGQRIHGQRGLRVAKHRAAVIEDPHPICVAVVGERERGCSVGVAVGSDDDIVRALAPVPFIVQRAVRRGGRHREVRRGADAGRRIVRVRLDRRPEVRLQIVGDAVEVAVWGIGEFQVAVGLIVVGDDRLGHGLAGLVGYDSFQARVQAQGAGAFHARGLPVRDDVIGVRPIGQHKTAGVGVAIVIADHGGARGGGVREQARVAPHRRGERALGGDPLEPAEVEIRARVPREPQVAVAGVVVGDGRLAADDREAGVVIVVAGIDDLAVPGAVVPRER